MLHQPIGVFDSGLGGISVLREIHRLLPAEALIYVADSAHAPYGAKPPDYIRQRSQRVADFLLTQNAKALVVACNTPRFMRWNIYARCYPFRWWVLNQR